jgi:hypothetical protein
LKATTSRKANIATEDPRVPPSALPLLPGASARPSRRSASSARFRGGGI